MMKEPQNLLQKEIENQSAGKPILCSRRAFLGGLAVSAISLAAADLFLSPGALAEQLTRTPSQTEGPFYPFPDYLPLDTDNDLIVINDALTPAVGEITHLGGRILDARGNPIQNARVEIWQTDNSGVYIYGEELDRPERDVNFQGFGQFETGKAGEYRFRTIKPVPYPGRTPHIHVKVWKGEQQLLTTQFYIKGHPQDATPQE